MSFINTASMMKVLYSGYYNRDSMVKAVEQKFYNKACCILYVCVCVYIYICYPPPSRTYLFVFCKCILPCQPVAKALKHVNTGHEEM